MKVILLFILLLPLAAFGLPPPIPAPTKLVLSDATRDKLVDSILKASEDQEAHAKVQETTIAADVKIIADLNAAKDAQAADLTTTRGELAASKAAKTDLDRQITALNGDISDLNSQVFWGRFKWGFVGIAFGVVGALAAFIFTKIGIAVSSTAVKLGLKAATA